MNSTNYSTEVVAAAAKIGPHVRVTPLEYSPELSRITGAEVWLKLEHLQHTGSFKWRGALNRILSLTAEELERGVVTASNGNHGIAVCRAGALVGIRPLVFLRRGVPEMRVELIRQLGGEPHFHGENPLEAEQYAREMARQSGRTFISPYNDAGVIAGQGTLGLELAGQLEAIDAVFAAVGGGGLISGLASGLAAALKSGRSAPQVVGCWPANSPVLLECMKAGRIVEVDEQPTISDSTAGGIEAESLTLPLARHLIDRTVLVSELEIRQALRLIADYERWMVEGAAGVALAGLLRTRADWQGRRVVVVLCGRNISTSRFSEAINLPEADVVH